MIKNTLKLSLLLILLASCHSSQNFSGSLKKLDSSEETLQLKIKAKKNKCGTATFSNLQNNEIENMTLSFSGDIIGEEMQFDTTQDPCSLEDFTIAKGQLKTTTFKTYYVSKHVACPRHHRTGMRWTKVRKDEKQDSISVALTERSSGKFLGQYQALSDHYIDSTTVESGPCF